MRGILLLLILIFLVSCQQERSATQTQVKDIVPQKNYAMLIVESESCIYCKQLKKDLQGPVLSSELKEMDVYSIMYDSNAKVRYRLKGKEGISTEEELARSLGVNSFPQIFFYDREGNVVLHLPGYQPPQTLACSIRFVKEGKYRHMSYIDYMKANRCI